MRITVKHYYCFGKKAGQVGKNLLIPASWDAIRIDSDENTPFSIPEDRDKWVEKCKNHTAMAKRGEAIADFLKTKGRNFKKAESFGFGCGFMEYSLKAFCPEIFLSCSDFAPKAVERLKRVFRESDKIEVFDMLKDGWVNHGSNALYIFHRLDADFDNGQWDMIFDRMNKAGIENILFIPCDISKIKFLIKTKLGYFSQILQGNKMSFAGYLRTKGQFKHMLSKYYNIVDEIKIYDLIGFLLKIKNK